MCALEQYIILQLLIMQVPFSLFSEPRIYSIILYICSILMSKSPCAFARVPVPTQVNEGDMFISTQTRNIPSGEFCAPSPPAYLELDPWLQPLDPKVAVPLTLQKTAAAPILLQKNPPKIFPFPFLSSSFRNVNN